MGRGYLVCGVLRAGQASLRSGAPATDFRISASYTAPRL